MTAHSRSIWIFAALLAVLLTVVMAASDDFDDDAAPTLTFADAQPTKKPWLQFKPFNLRRLTWRDFLIELYLIAGFQIYIIIYILGKRFNQSLALGFVTSNLKLFKDNFAVVGDGSSGHVIYDGPSDYLVWLSGRRNVKYGTGRIALIPRQDLVRYIIEFAVGLFDFQTVVSDTVKLDFEFNVPFDDFVFGVTKKSVMAKLRKARYDIQTFIVGTKGTLDHPQLPNEFAVLSEAGEVTDTFVTKEIIDALNDPEVAKYFNYLIISDQPVREPEEEITTPTRFLTVSLNVPTKDAKAAKNPNIPSATTPILKAVMSLLDKVPQAAHFRPETRSKLRRARDDANKRFLKAKEAEREEALIKKRLEKKREEDARIAKLSPDEQRKHEERERKRDAKKAQKKMTKKA